jgi:hypothetical protein
MADYPYNTARWQRVRARQLARSVERTDLNADELRAGLFSTALGVAPLPSVVLLHLDLVIPLYRSPTWRSLPNHMV